MAEVVVYCAVSLDGFIAGPDGALDWLEVPTEPAGDGALDFGTFIADVGVLLMGRTTYDVVAGFGEWAYGDVPVWVVTHRGLDEPGPTIQAVEGDIRELLDRAEAAAGDGIVYLDGGTLITAALDAGRVDRLVLTVVPVLLGAGVPLYAGALRHGFGMRVGGTLGSMVQLVLEPEGREGGAFGGR